MEAVSQASFESAKSAATLAFNLVGIMALWLGLMRVLEAGGLMQSIARLVKPVMRRLFSDVPPEHPAMSAMVLNISANMLGLGNAATPFGIKAMMQLNRLNAFPGTATNAMCLFLAINTSSVALMPLGAIGVRAAAGCADPAAIWIPSLLATLTSTSVALVLALYFASRDKKYKAEVIAAKAQASDDSAEDIEATNEDFSDLRRGSFLYQRVLARLVFLGFALLAIRTAIVAPNFLDFLREDFSSFWLVPGLILLIICYGYGNGVRLYEAITQGAKQGFEIAIQILPFLVVILVVLGIFRASGAMEILASALFPLTNLIGMPPEVMPMALVRPLSGSGALAVMSEMVTRDPNSYSSFLASVMLGSTETTFYVIAVYFGAAKIVRIRHALIAALGADLAGLLASCIFSPFFWTAV
ncbi:UNVERIFIED_CONTAM: hypothetical protein GTU68_045087 [Idotea baltica]|nr:hypothetical protein [Idotea baltica]